MFWQSGFIASGMYLLIFFMLYIIKMNIPKLELMINKMYGTQFCFEKNIYE